jgi:hypothetical protein
MGALLGAGEGSIPWHAPEVARNKRKTTKAMAPQTFAAVSIAGLPRVSVMLPSFSH